MSALEGWMVTGGQDIRLVEGGGGVEPVLVGQKTSRLQKGAPAYLPSYLAPQLPATWPLQQAGNKRPLSPSCPYTLPANWPAVQIRWPV